MSSLGLTDYYGILGLERSADEAAIKKAYRRLVLQWHPDKHQTDRDVAEEKIREVNDAYENLSNPFKRNQYDQQLIALERKAQGIRLDTTSIKPRMCIPKEFMLSPMGHPEKFVRTVGMSIFVHARADAKMEFNDFFRDAKFSLWWLPEVNNMCRLRPTTTAMQGQDGGMNFNFFLHRSVNVSEVVLSPNVMPESVNVIAVASPVFPRAFRFEAAHFPGHYLAFNPPTHVRMMGGVVDQSTAIDFMLVDYAQMFQYITTEEVLMPAITKLGGKKDYVPLDRLRADPDVRVYFSNVLKKTMWSDEDFETFFESRPAEWEYNAKQSEVRLRSKHEQLANALRRARKMSEIAVAISSADDYDVCKLTLDTLEAALQELGGTLAEGQASVSLAISISDAQNKVLVALPSACEKDVSFDHIMTVYRKVTAFGGTTPDAKIAKRRGEAERELGEIVSEQIRDKRLRREDLSIELLTTLCNMPLSWKVCAERLLKLSGQLLEDQPLKRMLPLLQSTAKALPASLPLSERIADLTRKLLKGADASLAAEAMEVMVQAGLCLQNLPRSLERVLKTAPFATVANIVAGLGEKAVDGSDMRSCASFVGKSGSALEALPPEVLLRLCVAATKSTDVAEKALDAVAQTAAMTLPGWSTEDASKLLLAVAKAKAGTDSKGVAALYRRASEVLASKLQDFSSVQLIKVVLAIGAVAECKPLLEAAALEVATKRITELPSTQLVLLSQGVQPLSASHPAVVAVLEYWAANFNEANRVENLLTDSMGIEAVAARRKEQEAKGQLTADQVAKLAQSIAKVAPDHTGFWRALATRFMGKEMSEGISISLSSTGKAALESVFSRGGGPDFPEKADLLREIKKPGTAHKDREKERERERERSLERRREEEKRNALINPPRGKSRKGATDSSSSSDSSSDDKKGGQKSEQAMQQLKEKKLKAAEKKKRKLEAEQEHRKAQAERRKKLKLERTKPAQVVAATSVVEAVDEAVDLDNDVEDVDDVVDEAERRRQQRARRKNRIVAVDNRIVALDD